MGTSGLENRTGVMPEGSIPSLSAQILSLREQGLTYQAIATRLQCAKSTVSFHCGVGQKEKNARRRKGYRSRIRTLVHEFKTNKPYMDCGLVYPPYVMDFDHRPGEEKQFNISMLGSSRTEEDLWKEIAKCDLVCSNCHRERTWQRKVNG